MIRKATISECGKYRYTLTRQWDYSKPLLCWIMLNPSMADANIDDPTIRRCIDFSTKWGYGGLYVVNLFALRSVNPAELLKVHDPIGPENNFTIIQFLKWPIIAAWGAWGAYKNRDKHVSELLAGADIKCLGMTKMGQPKHPLYIAKITKLEIFKYLPR